MNLFYLQPSGWRKVRNMVQWTPFIQEFKNRKYQWVQLAGHSGNFKAGRSQGTVLKKLCPQEEHCYNQFSQDSLAPFVPEYQGTICLDNDESKSKKGGSAPLDPPLLQKRHLSFLLQRSFSYKIAYQLLSNPPLWIAKLESERIWKKS